MRVSYTLLAFTAGFAALTGRGVAQVAPQAATVSFSESADDVEANNPAPGVQGWTNFLTFGGNPSRAALFLFFPQAPQPFSFTYSLLEPNGDGEISDQITFSGGIGEGIAAQTLTIQFVSDPADFVSNVYGSADEIGGPQAIPLPNLPASGGNSVSVFAQSDLEGVPEPSTWAMALIGFAFLGSALRRQRRKGKLAPAA